MTKEIKVYVAKHGARRNSDNLVMCYIDPVTEKRVTRSTGTSDRREAERRAAVWQDELASGRYQPPSRFTWEEFRERYETEKLVTLAPKTWEAASASFNHLERICDPKLLSSVNAVVLSRFQAELRKPRKIERDVIETPRTVLESRQRELQSLRDGGNITVEKFTEEMNKAREVYEASKRKRKRNRVVRKTIVLPGLKDTAIASHLRHIKAALNWAVAMGILPRAPRIEMPKRAKGVKFMRGRPITAEEFDRMLAAVPRIRPADANAWVRYLTGVWLSGLRLRESTVLSWDDDSPIAVDLSGRHPRFRIMAEAEKAHQDRLLPMTPDFAEWILRTPESEREGVVFKLYVRGTTKPMAAVDIGATVSEIGRLAGVVVNKAQGKFASAHDLRRSFGTRWSGKVKPATLQLLMRHRSIETTLKYYVAQDADEVADELWQAHKTATRATHCATQSPKSQETPQGLPRLPVRKPLTETEVASREIEGG